MKTGAVTVLQFLILLLAWVGAVVIGKKIIKMLMSMVSRVRTMYLRSRRARELDKMLKKD
jgi:hypothetical protein